MRIICMKATTLGFFTLAVCLSVAIPAVYSRSEANRAASSSASTSWNPKAAAAYLDQRESYWMSWPKAARDHGTFCVSCHTAVPYALARPVLRPALAEETLSPNERKLVDNVTKRVRLWNEVEPFYSDEKTGVHKTAEARGTEAVLNALVLVSYDVGNGSLSDDTRHAFANMWSLQQATGDDAGSWAWLDFHNEPWEALDSQYYGAAIAAVAVGTAPGNYRSTPQIKENLKLLREYIQRGLATQSPINRVVVLWASARLPVLLTAEQQEVIAREISMKQRGDGGWSLSSLVGTWKRRDGTPLEMKSDGYATGLIILALEQNGIRNNDVHLKQGLSWLLRNQDKTEGFWPAYSLNKRRDPSDDIWPFMNDAATAYAVLALTQNNSH
jgi:squalene-hopene/tetraprenyl-beta-curcumene cyclase